MTADVFWELWRVASKARCDLTLPLMCRAKETPTVVDICDMCEDDLKLANVMHRYLDLTTKERKEFQGGSLLITVGWFKTCLPALMQEQQQDETERAKFLNGSI